MGILEVFRELVKPKAKPSHTKTAAPEPSLEPAPSSIFTPVRETRDSVLTTSCGRDSYGPTINEVRVISDRMLEPKGCVHVWQTIGDGASSKRCQNCGFQPGLPLAAAEVVASRPSGSLIERLWRRRV